MEYRDPDYAPPEGPKRAAFDPERVRAVIESQFRAEIESKERALAQVDDRLASAKKTLQRLRYVVVNHFYNTKTQQEKPETETEVQTRIHPAVKKILNENPSDFLDDLSDFRPTRKKAKLECENATSFVNTTIPADPKLKSLKTTIKTEKPTSSNVSNSSSSNKKNGSVIPMYVEPKGLDDAVLKILPVSRNKQKEKFRIIIGNTSKYLGPPTNKDFVTHRWLLYIRGPQDSPDVSHIIDSITVQLHDSYAPQNIIKLKSSPFHLSKRGWGEFPVKLRLHFKNETFNKPVNLVHNLKLDRLHTGVQTLGAETVADVWLYVDESMKDKNQTIPTESLLESYSNLGNNHKSEFCDEFNFNEIAQNTRLNSDEADCMNSNNFDYVKVKEEPMDYEDGDLNHDFTTGEFVEYEAATANAENSHDNSIVIKNEIEEDRCDDWKYETLKQVISREHSYTNLNQLNDNSDNLVDKNILLKLYKKVDFNFFEMAYNLRSEKSCNINIETISTINEIVLKKILYEEEYSKSISLNTLKNIAIICNIIICEYSKELISIFHQKTTQPLSIVKTSITNLRSAINTMEMILLTSMAKELKDFIDIDAIRLGKIVLPLFEKLFHDSFKLVDLRCIVNLLLRTMSVVMPNYLSEKEYVELFPYAVRNAEDYFSMNRIKRRNLLWTRAKMINNFVHNYFKMNDYPYKLWSTKQILTFSLVHGYFPASSHKTCENNSKSIKQSGSFSGRFQINTKTYFDSSALAKNDIQQAKKEKEEDDEAKRSQKNIYKDLLLCISDSSDDEIEVCDDESSSHLNRARDSAKNIRKLAKSDLISFNNDDEALQCRYIEKICRSVGVNLKNHNIGHRNNYGANHKIILTAVKCFVEDLVRRAISVKAEAVMSKSSKVNEELNQEGESSSKLESNIGNLWTLSEQGYPDEVSLKDIFEGLKTRSEFDFLTNYGLGSENVECNEGL